MAGHLASRGCKLWLERFCGNACNTIFSFSPFYLNTIEGYTKGITL